MRSFVSFSAELQETCASWFDRYRPNTEGTSGNQKPFGTRGCQKRIAHRDVQSESGLHLETCPRAPAGVPTRISFFEEEKNRKSKKGFPSFSILGSRWIGGSEDMRGKKARAYRALWKKGCSSDAVSHESHTLKMSKKWTSFTRFLSLGGQALAARHPVRENGALESAPWCCARPRERERERSSRILS